MNKSKFSGEYTADWPEIAQRIKKEAGWKCVRCGHLHDPENGYCLTVHHLTGQKNFNIWWNTPALCQKCHLTIQGKVDLKRMWMFDHSSWFVPFIAGYYAHIQRLPEDRDYVMAHIEELLEYGKPGSSQVKNNA